MFDFIFFLLFFVFVTSEENRENACEIKNIYHPADYEVYWKKLSVEVSEDRTKIWRKGCQVVRRQKKQINDWLQVAESRTSSKIKSRRRLKYKSFAFKPEMIGFNKSALSYYSVTKMCQDGLNTILAEVPIEPLIGFLRHPLFHCFANYPHMKVNKGYLIPMLSNEVYPQIKLQKRYATKFFFDLGASLYNTGFGGASQQWFVETYESHGLEFDRILAWEAKLIAQKEIFKRVPSNVMGKLQYFNVPAETDIKASGNPLRILKEITHKDDFVVVKIDIDNDKVELEFIRQILNDIEISSRIDELYFEHHVSGSPMEFYGWGRTWKNMTLAQSYDIFTQLRNLGIRAHSWV